jgi:hypothetical protein
MKRISNLLILFPFFCFGQDSVVVKVPVGQASGMSAVLSYLLKSDSTNGYSTRWYTRYRIDSVVTALGGKQASGSYLTSFTESDPLAVKITDSASMLLKYLRASEAAATYQPLGTYATGSGSASGTNTGDQDLSGLAVKANNLSDLANAATARSNLGATTVGGNIFTLSNPSAIRFLRINADNTVTARTAAEILSDIGAQAAGSYAAAIHTHTISQISDYTAPTTVSGNAGSATVLQTSRSIYGNNFDGSAALGQIIASTYGGTGNGFTKFTGPTTSEKTFTLPNASATILTTNAAVGIQQGGTGTTAASYTLNGWLAFNGSTFVTGPGITANRAIASDNNAQAVASATTDTELGYLSGTTSNVQTQLNSKASLASPAFTGTPTGIGIPVYARVTSSDATTTGQALTNVTGLSVALTTNAVYEFEAVLGVTTSAVTTGTQYAVQYSVAGGAVEGGITGPLTSTAAKAERIAALNTATSAYLTTSAQTGQVIIKGVITTGAN